MDRIEFRKLTKREREVVVTYNTMLNLAPITGKNWWKRRDNLLDVVLESHKNNVTTAEAQRIRNHYNYGWEPSCLEEAKND